MTIQRAAAIPAALAALLVLAAAWTAISRAPRFEKLDDHEVITCELAEPLDAEGWIDFGSPSPAAGPSPGGAPSTSSCRGAGSSGFRARRWSMGRPPSSA